MGEEVSGVIVELLEKQGLVLGKMYVVFLVLFVVQVVALVRRWRGDH